MTCRYRQDVGTCLSSCLYIKFTDAPIACQTSCLDANPTTGVTRVICVYSLKLENTDEVLRISYRDAQPHELTWDAEEEVSRMV